VGAGAGSIFNGIGGLTGKVVGGHGDLPLYWDLLVVAVFSLVIYFVAIASRLPEAEVDVYVRDVYPRDQLIETGGLPGPHSQKGPALAGRPFCIIDGSTDIRGRGPVRAGLPTGRVEQRWWAAAMSPTVRIPKCEKPQARAKLTAAKTKPTGLPTSAKPSVTRFMISAPTKQAHIRPTTWRPGLRAQSNPEWPGRETRN